MKTIYQTIKEFFYKPDPKPGQRYKLKDADPFREKFVEIVDFKQGWVKYKFTSRLLTRSVTTTCNKRTFLFIYELAV